MDHGISLTQNEESYIEFDSGAGEICLTPMLIDYLEVVNEKGNFVDVRLMGRPGVEDENQRWVVAKVQEYD